jgi:hypothetical protein
MLSRAGIINVYQYGDETLDFGGGRLLLRGVNGSGKSTAMNMLLPLKVNGLATKARRSISQTLSAKCGFRALRSAPEGFRRCRLRNWPTKIESSHLLKVSF